MEGCWSEENTAQPSTMLIYLSAPLSWRSSSKKSQYSQLKSISTHSMHLSAPFVASLSLCTCVAAVPSLSRKLFCPWWSVKLCWHSCQAEDKAKAAKLSTRSPFLDGSIHFTDAISHWLQKMKRQNYANVTVPQFLIQDVIAQGEALENLFITAEPLLPMNVQELFPGVIDPFNATLTELQSYTNSTGWDDMHVCVPTIFAWRTLRLTDEALWALEVCEELADFGWFIWWRVWAATLSRMRYLLVVWWVSMVT